MQRGSKSACPPGCLKWAHSDVYTADEAASAAIPFADTEEGAMSAAVRKAAVRFRGQIDTNGQQETLATNKKTRHMDGSPAVCFGRTKWLSYVLRMRVLTRSDSRR